MSPEQEIFRIINHHNEQCIAFVNEADGAPAIQVPAGLRRKQTAKITAGITEKGVPDDHGISPLSHDLAEKIAAGSGRGTWQQRLARPDASGTLGVVIETTNEGIARPMLTGNLLIIQQINTLLGNNRLANGYSGNELILPLQDREFPKKLETALASFRKKFLMPESAPGNVER